MNLLPALGAAGTNLFGEVSAAEQVEYQLSTESLVRTYQQHLEDLSRLDAARERLREAEVAARNWTGFAEPPPYSQLMVDELRDSVQSLSANIRALETTLGVVDRLSSEDKTVAKASEERLRHWTEQLETETDPAKISRISWQRSLDEIRNRLSLANASSLETRRQRLEMDLAGDRQRLGLARRQLAFASDHVEFTRADLEKVLSRIDTERHGLETELSELEAQKERQQVALTTARMQLRDAEKADPSSSQTRDIAGLQRSVELLTVQGETTSQLLTALRQMLQLSILQRGLWEIRYGTFESKDLGELRTAYKKLEHLLDLAQVIKPHFFRQLEAAQLVLDDQTRRIDSGTLSTAEAAHTRELLASHRERQTMAQRALTTVQRFERIAQRWKDSLDKNREALPVTGRFRDLFTELSSFGSKLWRFELYAVQDTIVVDGQSITGRRGITLGKTVLAILILGVGYWISYLVSGLIERLAVRKFEVEPHRARLFRRWARVVVIIALVLFTLISVKIPLTAFAFLGGALAIGLGFGTQNLLKNFISGIIILFERPFRVGDILDINGKRGKVNSIGIRSSVLEQWDGTETLIPNSSLLENDVTNWTYSSTSVRFSVTVGVAYGSDTRRVSDLLTEIADRHGLVQKYPSPAVFFQDFADSALIFELRYYVDVLKHNSAQVASDLRHMIAVSFAEKSIVISFPQRDLHVSTLNPLSVQLTQPNPSIAPEVAPLPIGEPPREKAESG